MPRYMILIYEPWAELTPATWDEAMEAHARFAEELVELGGSFVGGAALQPTTSARAVRGTRSAEPVVTDGPFVETKEAFGGFYLVEARDLDHATAIARRCPAPGGGVEVRPVLDTSAGLGAVEVPAHGVDSRPGRSST